MDKFIFNDDSQIVKEPIIDTYTQCKLSKDGYIGIAWIPSEFAQLDKIVKVKIDDKWFDGYKILGVYNTLPKEKVESNSRDYRQFEDVLKQ